MTKTVMVVGIGALAEAASGGGGGGSATAWGALEMAGAAFTPGRTQLLSVGGSASVSVNVNPDTSALRVANFGTNTVFVRFGTGPQTATVNDFPIFPNIPQYIIKGVGADTFAAIASTGTAAPDLYVTEGSMG